MTERTCACGCGEKVVTGTYRPGHDQKLRAAIERAVGGLESLRALAERHAGRPISGNDR